MSINFRRDENEPSSPISPTSAFGKFGSSSISVSQQAVLPMQTHRSSGRPGNSATSSSEVMRTASDLMQKPAPPLPCIKTDSNSQNNLGLSRGGTAIPDAFISQDPAITNIHIDQLWRLVESQRAMITCLRRDLETANSQLQAKQQPSASATSTSPSRFSQLNLRKSSNNHAEKLPAISANDSVSSAKATLLGLCSAATDAKALKVNLPPASLAVYLAHFPTIIKIFPARSFTFSTPGAGFAKVSFLIEIRLGADNASKDAHVNQASSDAQAYPLWHVLKSHLDLISLDAVCRLAMANEGSASLYNLVNFPELSVFAPQSQTQMQSQHPSLPPHLPLPSTGNSASQSSTKHDPLNHAEQNIARLMEDNRVVHEQSGVKCARVLEYLQSLQAAVATASCHVAYQALTDFIYSNIAENIPNSRQVLSPTGAAMATVGAAATAATTAALDSNSSLSSSNKERNYPPQIPAREVGNSLHFNSASSSTGAHTHDQLMAALPHSTSTVTSPPPSVNSVQSPFYSPAAAASGTAAAATATTTTTTPSNNQTAEGGFTRFFRLGAKNNLKNNISSSSNGNVSRSGNINQSSGAKSKKSGNFGPVFGVPLIDSIRIAGGPETDGLPAVVYRCIEFLDTNGAKTEEGIFRLSGSSAVISALRRRFDTSGDFDLISQSEIENLDIHAVAGLLKLFFRELPTSIFTSETRSALQLISENFNAIENQSQAGEPAYDVVAQVTAAISLLPVENYTLLKALMWHLFQIAENSNINKMTVRNLAIVFSPTLQVPVNIFIVLLTNYPMIFSKETKASAKASSLENVAAAGNNDTALQPTKPSVQITRSNVLQNSFASSAVTYSSDDVNKFSAPPTFMSRGDSQNKPSVVNVDSVNGALRVENPATRTISLQSRAEKRISTSTIGSDGEEKKVAQAKERLQQLLVADETTLAQEVDKLDKTEMELLRRILLENKFLATHANTSSAELPKRTASTSSNASATSMTTNIANSFGGAQPKSDSSADPGSKNQ